MPPRPNQLILILTVYILTLFTVLHTFRLALDLSPGRAPQTSSANTSAVSWSSALFSPSKLLRTLYEPKPENGQGVSWLVRLGWGLGEATIEILVSFKHITAHSSFVFCLEMVMPHGITMNRLALPLRIPLLRIPAFSSRLIPFLIYIST